MFTWTSLTASRKIKKIAETWQFENAWKDINSLSMNSLDKGKLVVLHQMHSD